MILAKQVRIVTAGRDSRIDLGCLLWHDGVSAEAVWPVSFADERSGGFQSKYSARLSGCLAGSRTAVQLIPSLRLEISLLNVLGTPVSLAT